MLNTFLRSEPAADSRPKRLYRIQRLISKGICAWIYLGLRYVLPDAAPATSDASTAAGEATTSQGVDETAGYVLDKEFALKIIPLKGEHGPLDQGYLKWVKRQLLNLNTLTHPHIMVLRDCLNVPNFKLQPSGVTVPAIAVALDRATHSLHDYLYLLHQKRQVLPEDAARWWFQQLMLAVDHCHKRSPVWNNIRPPNILVFREDGAAKNVLKLSGLGLAQLVLRGNSENDKAKPSLYLPPEMFKAAAEGTSMDAKLNSHTADIWACGVVLFQMMYPNTFHDHERTYQGHRWLEELQQKQLDSRQSPMCEQLLSMMLQEDPAQRATLEQVLTHPWFQVNLPPAALEMNERCLQRPPHVNGAALEELLNTIIYEATDVQL